jgi:hypothetical protein
VTLALELPLRFDKLYVKNRTSCQINFDFPYLLNYSDLVQPLIYLFEQHIVLYLQIISKWLLRYELCVVTDSNARGQNCPAENPAITRQ